MSLALDTLVLFLFIIIPGIAFRKFYFQGAFSTQYNSKSLANSFASSILPGLFIQFLTLILYQTVYDIDSSTIVEFYNEISNNTLPANLFDKDILLSLSFYILLMLVISWALAQLAWHIIRGFNLDRYYNIFRFQNHWHYYFTGEVRNFKQFVGLIDGEIIEVRADVLVRMDDGDPRLYTGVLNQHTINSSNRELECVYLTDVSIYRKDSKGKRSKKSIPGDIMILNANEIININLNYAVTKFRPFRLKLKSITPLIYFVILFLIIFSTNSYFSSDTLIKTMSIKVFFAIYFFIVTVFIPILFEKKKTVRQKSAIKGIVFLILFMSLMYYLIRFIF